MTAAAARRLRRPRPGQHARQARGADRARHPGRPVAGHGRLLRGRRASPTTSRPWQNCYRSTRCSAATPGSCCPPAATSPRWSTRRPTRRPASRGRREPRRPAGVAGGRADPSRAAGGPTSARGWASAAEPPCRTPDLVGVDHSLPLPAPTSSRSEARQHEQRHQVREHRPLAGHRLLPDRRPADRGGARLSGAAHGISSTTRCCR